jgi:hypothetical protein
MTAKIRGNNCGIRPHRRSVALRQGGAVVEHVDAIGDFRDQSHIMLDENNGGTRREIVLMTASTSSVSIGLHPAAAHQQDTLF